MRIFMLFSLLLMGSGVFYAQNTAKECLENAPKITTLSIGKGFKGAQRVIDSLHLFPNLMKLEIFDVPITSLPESIGSLGRLGEVRIIGTKIRTLPESIGQLSLLWRLDLIDNKLETLPESIDGLKKTIYASII